MGYYSLDLRERVARSQGSIRAIAGRFEVSTGFVIRMRRQQRETGNVAVNPNRGHRPRAVDEAGSVWLASLVRNEPELTLPESCSRHEATHGVKVSKSSMDRALQRLKLTYKKNRGRSAPAHRTG